MGWELFSNVPKFHAMSPNNFVQLPLLLFIFACSCHIRLNSALNSTNNGTDPIASSITTFLLKDLFGDDRSPARNTLIIVRLNFNFAGISMKWIMLFRCWSSRRLGSPFCCSLDWWVRTIFHPIQMVPNLNHPDRVLRYPPTEEGQGAATTGNKRTHIGERGRIRHRIDRFNDTT